MRRSLSLLVVLLACASLTTTQAFAGKPSGGGGAPRPPKGGGGLQLVPELVAPGPGETGDLATTSVNVGRSDVCFTSIGIYKGAPGQIGPMVVRLCPSPIGINQLNGCVPVSNKDLMADLGRNPSSYFVQVNTTLFPGGAMRAQLR